MMYSYVLHMVWFDICFACVSHICVDTQCHIISIHIKHVVCMLVSYMSRKGSVTLGYLTIQDVFDGLFGNVCTTNV